MLLKGAGGVYIELSGYTYYNSTHAVLAAAKNLQCPDCHMADASPSAVNAGRVGGHTMNIIYNDPVTNAATYNVLYSCNTAINGSTCHSSGTKITPAATATDVLGLEHNGKVKAVKDSLQALQIVFAKKNWIDTVANTVKSPLRIQSRKAAALWNFQLVREDRSTGIHNSQYALDILTAALAEMRKP
jgi:hypothetical protein